MKQTGLFLMISAEASPSYYRARYYDPITGRLMGQDPISFLGGDANLYRYVWNRPANFKDPRGLWGVGASVGGSFFGGAPSNAGTGLSFSNSVGGVVFGDPKSPTGLSAPMAFNSYGGAAGGTRPSSGICGSSGHNMTAGFNFGIGPAFVLTNGNNADDLSGKFYNKAIALGPVTIDIGTGNNGIKVISVSGGFGWGLGFANYTSNTLTYPAPSGGNTCSCSTD